MTDDEKWDELDKQAVEFRKATAELSEAVKAFGSATKIESMNQLAVNISKISKSDISNFVLDTSDLTTQILHTIEVVNQCTREQKLPVNSDTAAQDYLAKADQFIKKALEFQAEMNKILGPTEPFTDPKLEGMKSKIDSASASKTQIKDESSNTPVEKFAKACARFGAALVTLPLLLAGLVVAVAGSVAALGLWVPGLVIGAGVTIATRDEDAGSTVASLVTMSIALVGEAMYVAGEAAGVYAVHGDNAFKDDDKQVKGLFFYQ